MAFPNKDTQFKKGQSGNPEGRSRKYVSELRAQGYTRSQVIDCIQVMLSMNIEELKEVYKNPKATALEINIAASLRKSIEKGSLDSIETLLNRLFGKPNQQMDLNASGGFKIEVTYKDADDTD